jgi:hypothetical protein
MASRDFAGLHQISAGVGRGQIDQGYKPVLRLGAETHLSLLRIWSLCQAKHGDWVGNRSLPCSRLHLFSDETSHWNAVNKPFFDTGGLWDRLFAQSR